MLRASLEEGQEPPANANANAAVTTTGGACVDCVNE
jgi:hypothetical protein